MSKNSHPNFAIALPPWINPTLEFHALCTTEFYRKWLRKKNYKILTCDYLARGCIVWQLQNDPQN